MTGEPPVLVGADQVTVAVALPAVCRDVGQHLVRWWSERVTVWLKVKSVEVVYGGLGLTRFSYTGRSRRKVVADGLRRGEDVRYSCAEAAGRSCTAMPAVTATGWRNWSAIRVARGAV